MKTAVIIARFQTPYLHDGHKQLIAAVLASHAQLVIVLGVSPVIGSVRNPFDYRTRETMIKREYPQAIILPLPDQPSDKAWSDSLDSLLMDTFPHRYFCLYGSRDSFIPAYSGRFEVAELPGYGSYNATDLRAQYSENVIDSCDFRAGILYAYHHEYARTYPTVDIAVFRAGRTELLLGRKAVSTGWRLPGGFADPADDSYEAAARRELAEECGNIAVSEMTYVTSQKIDDWRYRNETGKIITMLFTCDLISGNAHAHDDLVEVAWIPLAALPQMMVQGLLSAEHHNMINHLINKFC